MSNYRRLISYIYAYEGGIKGKNIGFAKIEVRNGQCRIHVNVKKIFLGSSDIGVYLLSPNREILLGRIFIRNGAGEFRVNVSAGNVEGSGCTMEQCYGLTIHETENTWRTYTTIWEDAVTQAAEVELADVPGWESVDPYVVIEDMEKPLFAYFKMPMANSVELRSPLGVSVYAKAASSGVLKNIDKQWSNILWEYNATQASVFGDEEVFKKDEKGNLQLEGRDKRLFRTFEGLEEKLKEYAPNIRDTSLFNGLDKMLKQAEFQCSLAYGTISDPANTDKTATEVKQSKQRSFSLVCDIQNSFQTAHENLIHAIYELALLYELSPDGEYETMFDFDDSIVVDRDVEFSRLMQMAAANMIRPEVVTAWYFGVSEDEAIKMLPPAFGDADEDNEPPETEEE